MSSAAVTESWIISALLAIVSALFVLLIALVGWLGDRLYARLGEMADSIRNIETDLHGKIIALDKRTDRLEMKVFYQEGQSHGRTPMDH